MKAQRKNNIQQAWKTAGTAKRSFTLLSWHLHRQLSCLNLHLLLQPHVHQQLHVQLQLLPMCTMLSILLLLVLVLCRLATRPRKMPPQ